MLTRRHIRVKVLQSIYAYNQSEYKDLEKQEKFLLYNMEQIQDLYLLMLQMLVSLRDQAENYLVVSQKKHLATELEKNPSRTFINNKIISLIGSNEKFNNLIEKRNLNYWKNDSEYVSIIFNELKEKDWYLKSIAKNDTSFLEDKDLIIKIFKEIIAPNNKLYEYLEDKRLTWLDDFPLVNTLVLKTLQKLTKKNTDSILIPVVYKNNEDRDYALLGVLGKGITSLIFDIPVANKINLSRPRPKPLCLTVPYFLKSRYHQSSFSSISKSLILDFKTSSLSSR